MAGDIFRNIIDLLRSTAPIFVVFNIGFGIILLIVGLIILKKQPQTQGQSIGGWICVIISVLALLGTVSNLLFTYLLFA